MEDNKMQERRGGLFRRGGRVESARASEGGGSLANLEQPPVGPPEKPIVTQEPPREDKETSLPELGLTPVVRSSEPVVKVESGTPITPKDCLIQPYGEYTIVLAKGTKEIQILDKQGRKIEGINTSTMIIDWETLRKKGGKDQYSYLINNIDRVDQKSRNSYLQPLNLPQNLQAFALERVANNPFFYIPSESLRIDTDHLDKTSIYVDEGLIFISQMETDKENFIFFATKSPDGVDVHPRNWQRYDVSNLLGNYQRQLGAFGEAVRLLTQNNIGKFSLVAVGEEDKTFFVFAFQDRVAVQLGVNDAKDVFNDKLQGVGNNLCLDPKNKTTVYFCSSTNPKTINKLDLSSYDFNKWAVEEINLPQDYKNVENLRLDSTGNFFTFESDGKFVILDRDGLKEVKSVPKLYNGVLDEEGRVRGVDEKGHLVVCDLNFQELSQELDARRITAVAKDLAANLFKKDEQTTTKVEEVDKFKHLVSAKTDLETQFNRELQSINSLEHMSTVTQVLDRLKSRLSGEGLKAEQIGFITEGIQDLITARERILAAPVVAQGLSDLKTKLTGNLTIASIAEAKVDLAKLKSLEGLVDDATKPQIRALEDHFIKQSEELFRTQGITIKNQVTDIIEGVRKELDAMTSMREFDDWQEFVRPKLSASIAQWANSCPLPEAYDTLQTILQARRLLDDIARNNEDKFKTQYAQVREKAAQLIDERVGLTKGDINSFMERLRARGFKERGQAETYINSTETLEGLKAEIAELARQNPDAARELDRTLKVGIANVVSEIERGGLTTIAETGQQMVRFGNVFFPRWEARVQEKTQKKVDLIFIANPRSEGPGVAPDKIYGDVGLNIINSRGKLEKIRLYEGWNKEGLLRLGIMPLIPPSYVDHAKFQEIRKHYADWNLGKNSKIRLELEKKSQALRQWRRERLHKPKTSEEETQWRGLLDDYISFYAKNDIAILQRVDRVKRAPETEYENGKGFPEEWHNNWVVDKTTEAYLEKMAQILKMQLDQQSGILTIRGNPGSGKDVLISMFSNMTNRPYFGTDCTKWDTPYEFSEDIVLESKDGASQTVHVPSTVLNGITTPGAIVYLNEIHALTEPTQIFLHALTDAKRRITLKTLEGKVIKVLDSVVLIASMNPSEKDNVEPALRDRMVFMDVDYPPLFREKDSNDPNQNPCYDASETLRIARDVDSLSELTIDPNMDRNEFVKMWDKYVNGIDNGAQDPSAIQRFDIDVILALVQFANKLRENFVARMSRRTQTASRALPVSLPATGRPLRDCAYALSDMPSEQKATGDPEAVAKKLLEDWFLSKIDNVEDRNTIKTAMDQWHSSKRVAA